jgi:hypothetical protein
MHVDSPILLPFLVTFYDKTALVMQLLIVRKSASIQCSSSLAGTHNSWFLLLDPRNSLEHEEEEDISSSRGGSTRRGGNPRIRTMYCMTLLQEEKARLFCASHKNGT